MTPAPRVSIVIPAWNAAGFIEKTLATVAAQTFRDFEVIVVDDGSHDDTHMVVERFLAAEGLRGRCIKQQNRKIAGARNTGIRAAQAELISFLDHDDLWFPNKLARTMAEFDAHPDADLVCHHENVVKGGRLVRVSRNGPWVPDMYERLLFDGNALSPSAVTVKRSKLLVAGLFREDERFNTVEDYDLWMRLAKICSMRFIDEVLGEYQLVERAASRRIQYHNDNLEALLRDHFSYFFGPNPGLAARLRMRRRLAAAHRSALGSLLQYGEDPGLQRHYVGRMLAAYPFDPKNLYRAAQWLVSRR